MTPDLVSAIAASVSAAVGIVLCLQLFLIKSHFNKEHQYKRNLHSNEIIRWWVETANNRVTGAARQVVECFSPAQCRSLVNNEAVHLILPEDNEEQRREREYLLEKIKVCLEENHAQVEIQGSSVTINASEFSLLRSLTTRYLNSMETVCSAWRHHLVNRALIEEEFTYIVHVNRGYRMLQTFREQSGGTEAFPAIYEFIVAVGPKLKKGEEAISG